MSHLRRLPIPILLALGGCAGLLRSNQPAVQLYTLQAPGVAAAGAAAVTMPAAGPTLRIARPLPAPGLNTDRIALLRSGNRLDYYAGGRWSGPLADLVADLELATLRGDPAWSAVADERAGLNADYVLHSSIAAFAAEYATDAGPPTARVSLQCLLVRRSDGALLGEFPVTASQVAQENRMSSVIAAFSLAAGRAAGAVATQLDQLVRSAKSPAAP